MTSSTVKSSAFSSISSFFPRYLAPFLSRVGYFLAIWWRSVLRWRRYCWSGTGTCSLRSPDAVCTVVVTVYGLNAVLDDESMTMGCRWLHPPGYVLVAEFWLLWCAWFGKAVDCRCNQQSSFSPWPAVVTDGAAPGNWCCCSHWGSHAAAAYAQ